jgi:hypothetical protein
MKYSLITRVILSGMLAVAMQAPCSGAHIGDNSYTELILHYTVSAGISFTSCLLISRAHPELTLTNKYMISAGIGLAFGVGKETIDELSGGDFDMVDIGFDVLGIASGLLLHYCIIDRKKIRGDLSFNIADPRHLASLKIRF